MEWFLGIGLEELCLGDDGDVKDGVVAGNWTRGSAECSDVVCFGMGWMWYL